jgi:cyclophilin family peptidyl-prolyl cis-trans isomerase
MIQGGGFTPGLQQKKAREPIKNEARNRVKNREGTVAMARTGGVNTATAQFFINTGDNREFDHKGMDPRKFGYTVFGRVIEGMDVVERIDNIKTTKRNGMRNVPSVHVVIMAVRLVD